MTSKPPEGLSDLDYEAIEAAVTETVRGRWFLNEFARRNRAAEGRQLLDAMGRIEAMVANQATLAPSADPSIRLIIQRVKDIAGQLDDLAQTMREEGVEDMFCEAVNLQARSVSGLMRNAAGGKPLEPSSAAAPPRALDLPSRKGETVVSASSASVALVKPAHAPAQNQVDPRLAAFADLDALPPAERLALFT